MIDYYKEFSLNVQHQLKDEKIEEVITVGYTVDNYICMMILIPRFFLPIKVKKVNKAKSPTNKKA